MVLDSRCAPWWWLVFKMQALTHTHTHTQAKAAAISSEDYTRWRLTLFCLHKLSQLSQVWGIKRMWAPVASLERTHTHTHTHTQLQSTHTLVMHFLFSFNRHTLAVRSGSRCVLSKAQQPASLPDTLATADRKRKKIKVKGHSCYTFRVHIIQIMSPVCVCVYVCVCVCVCVYNPARPTDRPSVPPLLPIFMAQ